MIGLSCILTFILTFPFSPWRLFTDALILLVKVEVGAGEGNRTLVTAIVVSSGSKWPDSLGNSIESQGVSCTTCTQRNMSEVWRISIARSVHRFGIFNTSIREEKSTTNPLASGQTIQTTPQKRGGSVPNWKPMNTATSLS